MGVRIGALMKSQNFFLQIHVIINPFLLFFVKIVHKQRNPLEYRGCLLANLTV